MSQEFHPHPILVNYEASRDGIVKNRRLKKPVGFVSNTGYLRFGAGKKSITYTGQSMKHFMDQSKMAL